MNKAKLIEKRQLTEDVFEFIFETEEHLKFGVGQFITLKLVDENPTPCFRAYSIASGPSQKHIDLCIKIIPNGRGTSCINKFEIGNEVEFIGPNGKFTFNSIPEKSLLFIATGTGIAPLKSIIEEQLAKGNTQNMHLLFGLRHIKDIFYKDFFEELEKKYKNFKFTLTLSQPEDDSWKGNKGRVTNLLENLEIDSKNTDAYICGLKAMIDSVTEILKEKGLSQEEIHFEKYD